MFLTFLYFQVLLIDESAFVWKSKRVKGLNKGNLWENQLSFLCVSLLSVSHCVCCVSTQAGKKAVRAVLWVSADGLRVVDDKTKVLWTDPPDNHSTDPYSTVDHNEGFAVDHLKRVHLKWIQMKIVSFTYIHDFLQWNDRCLICEQIIQSGYVNQSQK